MKLAEKTGVEGRMEARARAESKAKTAHLLASPGGGGAFGARCRSTLKEATVRSEAK